MPCRQYVERTHQISMILVSAFHKTKTSLSGAIRCRYLPTLRTPPTGVLGRHPQQFAATPGQLVGQLATELGPSLIENGSVESRLRTYLMTGGFPTPCRRLRHVPHRQILQHNDRVVFADGGGDLVQKVVTSLGDSTMNAPPPLDLAFSQF
jgi:hypothetical protein